MFFKELLIVFKNLKLTNSLPYEAKTSVIFQLLQSLVEESVKRLLPSIFTYSPQVNEYLQMSALHTKPQCINF